MKIGYPCINLSLNCTSSGTIRLSNYSMAKIKEKIKSNLSCLRRILEYNLSNNIQFFRISSDLIPLASDPIMDFNWQKEFTHEFIEIGNFIRENRFRITMHPGQYTVLNSIKEKVYKSSINDIAYHINVLDLMELDSTAKVQIHVGGVYNQKKESLNRFIERYKNLPDEIKNRLVIENDHNSYGLKDCLKIHDKTNIPIIFDVYHHECNNSGESLDQAFTLIKKTWLARDGIPIIHYSSEHPIKGKGSHSDHLDFNDFKEFLNKTRNFNFDLMLEIKDKEKSALAIIDFLEEDLRFNSNKLK